MKKPSYHTQQNMRNGFNHCRTCYKHLAGYIGVLLTDAMETRGYLSKSEPGYTVTEQGWKWLSKLDILKEDFSIIRRPLTRQCIDGTERRPHLAGALGDKLLEKMLAKNWFERVPETRKLIINPDQHKSVQDYFGIDLSTPLIQKRAHQKA